MYTNKCIKCGKEFETKNPKRVICPECLYPERITSASVDTTDENELNNKDNLVDYSGDIINLEDQKNGWYKWTGTIDSIYSVWIIQKMSSLYIATSINDPRIVLNSNNLTTWYSPYGYWHA